VPGQQILDTQTAENSFEFNTTEDDKRKFFANLEQIKGSSALDYEVLNAELDEQTEPEIPKDILDEIDRINHNVSNKEEDKLETSGFSQISSLSHEPDPLQSRQVDEEEQKEVVSATTSPSVSDFEVSTQQLDKTDVPPITNNLSEAFNYSVSSFEELDNNTNNLDQTSIISEPMIQGTVGGDGVTANDSTF
jgi:hypothetical protein